MLGMEVVATVFPINFFYCIHAVFSILIFFMLVTEIKFLQYSAQKNYHLYFHIPGAVFVLKNTWPTA